MKLFSDSPEKTVEIGKRIAEKLKKGYLVLLEGELGAGKTQLVKGIASFFKAEDVASPSFTIVNEYPADNFKLFHVDLYRLDGFPEEDIDLDEMLQEGIVIVEWWEKSKSLFLKYTPRVIIKITVIDENKREFEIICK